MPIFLKANKPGSTINQQEHKSVECYRRRRGQGLTKSGVSCEPARWWLPVVVEETTTMGLFARHMFLYTAVLAVASFTAELVQMVRFFQYEDFHVRFQAVLPEYDAAQKRSTVEDWRYHYMDFVPSPGQPWPVQAVSIISNANDAEKTKRSSNFTLTTCIPALFRDVEENLPALLRSIAAQTVTADEVVIVISDVPAASFTSDANQTAAAAEAREYSSDTITTDEIGTHVCQESYLHLRTILLDGSQNDDDRRHIALRLVCVGERMTAGRARNVAGRLAAGDIISYMDADDLEYPERNQVVLSLFDCHPNLKMVLHSCQRGLKPHKYNEQRIIQYNNDTTTNDKYKCADEEEGLQVVRGISLYDSLQNTHQRLWLHADMAHGHLVVHHSVLQHVHFSSVYHGEDSIMVRDILYRYGRSDDSAIFINRPLTTYIQPSNANQDLIVSS